MRVGVADDKVILVPIPAEKARNHAGRMPGGPCQEGESARKELAMPRLIGSEPANKRIPLPFFQRHLQRVLMPPAKPGQCPARELAGRGASALRDLADDGGQDVFVGRGKIDLEPARARCARFGALEGRSALFGENRIRELRRRAHPFDQERLHAHRLVDEGDQLQLFADAYSLRLLEDDASIWTCYGEIAPGPRFKVKGPEGIRAALPEPIAANAGDCFLRLKGLRFQFG